MSKMRRKGKASPHSKKIQLDGSKETPPNIQSLLFNPHQMDSSTSIIVPETPKNSPRSSASLTTLSTIFSVMETPEDEAPNFLTDKDKSASSKPDILKDVHCKRSINCFQKNDSCNEQSEDSININMTPNRNLDKRKKLLSLLESEHSFSKSLQSQKLKNSSMLFSHRNDEKTRMELEEERGIVSIGGGRRKRKSLAHVILPFDLNSSLSLSNKLNMMKEDERKNRRSLSTLRSPQTNSGRTLPTQTGKSNNDGGEKTILFDSEDLSLTPVKSSSQILIETSVHSIIDGLSTQHLDETGGKSCLVKDNQKVPVLSCENISTCSNKRVCRGFQSQTHTGGTLSKDHLKRRQCDEMKKGEKTATSSLPTSSSADEIRKDDCDIPHKEPTSPQSALKSTLQGVVAYVEVRMESDNRSAVIKDQLKALGAEVRERLTAEVTHVIFKDGSKSVFNRAMKRGLHLVSSLWVEACREKRQRISEVLFPSCSMETYKEPLHVVKLRKLRSMQPREFSEEEKIAAARVQRRLKSLKSQATPDSVPDDLQFGSPQHSSVRREAVDSPLFGISHLLTPQRQNSGSSSPSEEEENSPGVDLPSNFNSPLAKRLYDWFVSPKTDSQRRRQQSSTSRKERPSLDSSLEDIAFESVKNKSEKGKVDPMSTEDIGCQMKVEIKDVQDNNGVNSDHIQDKCVTDNDSNGEMIEMPVRLNVKLSKTETVNTLKNQTKNQAQNSKPKPRRSSRISRKFITLSSTNKDLALECGDSNYNSESSDSSLGQSNLVDKSKPWSQVVEKSRPDLDKCDSNCNTDIDKDNLSQKRRSTSSEEEEAISKVNDLVIKCVATPGQGNCKVGIGKSQNNRATRSIPNLCNDKTVEEGLSEFKERKTLKSVRDSTKRKPGIHTSQRETVLLTECKLKTCHSVLSNNEEVLADDLHTEKEKLCGKTHSLNENVLTFSDSQRTSSFSSSQARGRKLLSVDVLEPSQDLIMPVTPDNHGRFTQGPYTGLEIKGSKTQRASQRNQKGSSSMPLPRNSSSVHSKKKTLNFSTSSEDTKTSSSFVDENLLKLQLSTSSSTQNSSFKASRPENEKGFSSEDESVFPESKILSLPRPRRSTDEFQFSNELKPKGRRKCKSKSGNHPSICLTSVHSKDRSSLLPIIKKLGSNEVTECVNHSTTHVVCGEARRTLNLLLGIARGCWILDVSWLYQSLEMGAWAPEEPFELFTFCPGAKICRQQKEIQGTSYQQTLFSGVGSICVLDGCLPSSPQLRELLQLCGAVLVSTTRSANLVIGKCTTASEARESLAQITHISEKWALDSIQQHKIQPLTDYKLE